MCLYIFLKICFEILFFIFCNIFFLYIKTKTTAAAPSVPKYDSDLENDSASEYDFASKYDFALKY